MCCCRLSNLLEKYLHNVHLWGSSPQWTFLCNFRSSSLVSPGLSWFVFSVFSSLWVWVFRYWAWFNDFFILQCPFSFSPLCTNVCLFRESPWANVLPQWLHLFAFVLFWANRSKNRALNWTMSSEYLTTTKDFESTRHFHFHKVDITDFTKTQALNETQENCL